MERGSPEREGVPFCRCVTALDNSLRQAAAPNSRLRSLTLTLIIQTKHTLIAIYPSPHALRRARGRVLLKHAVNFKNKLLVLIMNKVSVKPLQRLAYSKGSGVLKLAGFFKFHIKFLLAIEKSG